MSKIGRRSFDDLFRLFRKEVANRGATRGWLSRDKDRSIPAREEKMADAVADKKEGKKDGKRFEVKKWNAVALWAWGACFKRWRSFKPPLLP